MEYFLLVVLLGVIYSLIKDQKAKKRSSRHSVNRNAVLSSTALTSAALLSLLQVKNDLTNETIDSLETMDLEELKEFAFENGLISQEDIHGFMVGHNLHDPYHTPGVDLIIDESYHGIDRGMGISSDNHNNHNDFVGGNDINNNNF